MTADVADAISPTAFIPSMVRYIPALNSTDVPNFRGVITLFEIPDCGVSDEVKHVIHAQAFAHEYAHTVLTPELHSVGLPNFEGDGEPFLFVMDHVDMVEVSGPISHYASAYMVDGQFRPGKDDGLTSINEWIAEAIVARLFGFAFQSLGNGLNPFEGREALAVFVDAYLAAIRG